MAEYDDLLADVPDAGGYDDLTAGVDSNALDPNSVRLQFGLGKYVDVPVPWWLQPVAKAGVWVDDNMAAPIARGATSLPGLAADAALWAGQKAVGADTDFGQVTQGAQDLLDIDARPADAGFGTDVLEALGGGLGFSAGLNAVTRSASLAPTLAREAPMAVASVLGQYGGEGVGEYFGGETGRVVGGILGSVAGGGTIPATHANVVKPTARAAFAKSGPNLPDGRTPSRAAYDDLVASGITPRPGLVGNRSVARLENTMAGVPIVGNIPQNRIDRNFRQYQQALYDEAYGVAGRQTPVDPRLQNAPGEATLGAQMRTAADVGLDRLNSQLSRGYDDFYASVPEETLVVPDRFADEVVRQRDAFTGEAPSTNAAISGFIDENVRPTFIQKQGPTAPTGAPLPAGIPIQRAGKVATEAFYDAQGGKMVGGATEQVRQAFKKDIDSALMNDPAMVQAFPDPADRLAQIERLKVLHTEYALARAKDVSRAGGTQIDGRFYVGGDIPALESIKNSQLDTQSFTRGSQPDNMAVLQRNMPPPGSDPNVGMTTYGDLAAGTILQNAQTGKPRGDINISPDVFARWWNNLDENQKLILSNEGFTPGRSWDASSMPVAPGGAPRAENFDRLARVGELFRDSAAEANPSGTAPTLATLGMMTGLLYDPMSVATMATSNALAGSLASSEELARIIAGVGPGKMAETAQGFARALPHAAALNNQQDWMMQDANGNYYDINGNLVQ